MCCWRILEGRVSLVIGHWSFVTVLGVRDVYKDWARLSMAAPSEAANAAGQWGGQNTTCEIDLAIRTIAIDVMPISDDPQA